MSKKDIKLKAGIWQYIIDHASVADNRMIRVQFHVHSESDFWQRVNARAKGLYIRKDQIEFEKHASDVRRCREQASAQNRKRLKILNKLNVSGADGKVKVAEILRVTAMLDALYKNESD